MKRINQEFLTAAICLRVTSPTSGLVRFAYCISHVLIAGLAMLSFNGVQLSKVSIMKIETRIKQSQMAVRSGKGLICFFLLIAIVAFFFQVFWIMQLSGIVAGFFTLVTLLEYWNVRRLTKRLKSH